MNRRNVLRALTVAPFAIMAARRAWPENPAPGPAGIPPRVEELQASWKDFLPHGSDVALRSERLERSQAEWKKILTPAQYNVLREEGTEAAFTSRLNDEKRPGVFLCAGCDQPLFTSAMKYDSGTGWPSFFTTIPGVFDTKTDYHLLLIPRTEYHCRRCGGHQGHVFDDGPPPTGNRWCNNGVALRFLPKAGAA